MLVQEERKACGEFGGAEIKDCETENMATSQAQEVVHSIVIQQKSLEQDGEGGQYGKKKGV